MGMFDPEEFANSMQEAEELSTTRLSFDAGVYPAVVSKVDVVGGEKDGREWGGMDLKWQIEDEGVKAAVKRETVIVSQKRIFFDLTESGKLDTSEGSNVDLGRLLKAVGLNGKKWSPQSLVGQRALVHVKKVPIKDSPDGDTRPEVVGVAAGA